MRKLVIILSVFFLVILSSGFAAGFVTAETMPRTVTINLLDTTFQADSIASMIPFAITADDGGALGEKAKVQAMRLESKPSASEWGIFIIDEDQEMVRLTHQASLTAIREEEV